MINDSMYIFPYKGVCRLIDRIHYNETQCRPRALNTLKLIPNLGDYEGGNTQYKPFHCITESER